MSFLSPLTRPPAFNPDYVSPLPSPSAPPLPLSVNMLPPSPSKNPPEDDANLPPVEDQAYKFIEFINNWHKACEKAGLKLEQAYRYTPQKLTSVDAGFSQGFQINDTEKNQSLIKAQEQLNGTKQIVSQHIEKIDVNLIAQLMFASIIAAGAKLDTKIVLDGPVEIINELNKLLTDNGYNQTTIKEVQEKEPSKPEAATLFREKPKSDSPSDFFRNTSVNNPKEKETASSQSSLGKGVR